MYLRTANLQASAVKIMHAGPGNKEAYSLIDFVKHIKSQSRHEERRSASTSSTRELWLDICGESLEKPTGAAIGSSLNCELEGDRGQGKNPWSLRVFSPRTGWCIHQAIEHSKQISG